MEKRFIYKAKGYNMLRDAKFKVLIAATCFDEAWHIAELLAGAGGWIISVKDMDKEIIVEGSVNDQQV